MQVLSVNKMFLPEIGGVEVVAFQLAKLFDKLGFRSVALSFSKTNRERVEQFEGIRVIRIPTNFRRDPVRLSLKYRSYFLKLAKESKLVVFHYPSFQPELDFIISNPRLDVKKLCFYHAEVSGRGSIGRFYNTVIASAFLGKMDRIVVTSPNTLDSTPVLQKFRDKVEIIPLFVDTAHFYFRKHNRRRELLKTFDAPVRKIVLYVGRLGRYKGLEYLIRALNDLPKDYGLVLIGRGPREEKLRVLVDRMDLTERVIFLDHVSYEALPEYYSAADVFVLPSIDRGEAFGIVALEAMACGIPVITTELGTGTTYHNIDGVTGLHVKPRSVEQLSKAIAKIVTEDWKHNKSEAIVQRAQEFDVSVFESRFKRLIGELMDSRS